MAIGDKKASLIKNDGSNITLNKPITIPSSVTDISQITEPGWYHGSFNYSVNKDGDNVTDTSNVKNTPAIKIEDELTSGTSYGYDVFVAGTGDYIFNLEKSVFYGKKLENASITWYKVSPLVKDWLDSTDSEAALSANCGRLLKEELDTKSDKSHVHNSLKRTEDKRDIATKPSDYSNELKFVGIKTEKAVGLSNSERYVALFGVNPWSDSSGDGATEIAIDFVGAVHVRKEDILFNNDTFNKWSTVIMSTNVIDNLTSTSTTKPLSAKMGKVLNDEKAASKVLAADIDLNTVKTPGIYSCGGSNSIKNKPNGIDAIGLIVVHDANGEYYTQILTTSTNRNTYRRYCKDGTWDSWTVDKYTDTDSWRGIQNNLTSNSTTESLSAAQGKVLNENKLDKPTISTNDLTAGTSNLATGQLYFVYE